jgi:predicted RNase H-like nuclease (RuvC/YqgF family)
VIEFLEEVKFVVEGSPLISYQPARLKKQKKSNESLTNESNPISSEFSQKTNDDPKVIGRLRDNVRKLRKQQIENSRTIAELNINLNDAKGQISELKKEKNHFHNQSETFGGLF